MADDNNNNNNNFLITTCDGNKTPNPTTTTTTTTTTTLLSDNFKLNNQQVSTTSDLKERSHLQQFPVTKAHLNDTSFSKSASSSPLTSTTNFITNTDFSSPYVALPSVQAHNNQQQQNLVWNENVSIYPTSAASATPNTHNFNYGTVSLQVNQHQSQSHQMPGSGGYDWSIPSPHSFNCYNSNEYNSSTNLAYQSFNQYPSAQYQSDYYSQADNYYHQQKYSGIQGHQVYMPVGKVGPNITGMSWYLILK